MIEYHAVAQQRMTRAQCAIHCVMILSVLDRVDRLLDDAIARCGEAKILDAYGEG